MENYLGDLSNEIFDHGLPAKEVIIGILPPPPKKKTKQTVKFNLILIYQKQNSARIL